MMWESRDSASPVITRAVASGLLDRPLDVFRFAPWQKAVLRLANGLPASLANALVRWDSGRQALPRERARAVRVDDLLQERLADYAGLKRRFDCVVMGAAIGGAAAHLSIALGAPFLPQPFILGFRGGSPHDEVEQHFRHALKLAEAIQANNADILILSHFDPIHDGWLTRSINHVRIKLLSLPDRYARFLRERLNPGGSIVYLDCRAAWPQYQIDPQHRYQIGGWGGVSPGEFLQGSARMDAVMAQRGSSHRGGWSLQGYALQQGPESEWGSEPGLDVDLQRFCQQEGYRFLRIQLPHPADFARLALNAQQERIKLHGLEPQGVVVETFTQYAPTLVERGSLLPLWLIFNTQDSLAFLQSMQVHFPEDKPVFFSGLITFSKTPDMVPFDAWARALQAHDWVNIGPRASRYPHDLVALWRWQEPLRDWVKAHPQPLSLRLTPAQLMALLP